ncbi:MAG: N-acetyltransferase [Anaerolineae bacterium]|nr:N-acetyltransferase [Anaerolineae bacterium]
MIFETLWESVQRGELMLIDGGFCHWHLCKRDDPRRKIEAGQITIREIISTRTGAGTEILETLKRVPGAKSLFARCPVDLDSNEWYRRRGFALVGTETTQTGRQLNLWRLRL